MIFQNGIAFAFNKPMGIMTKAQLDWIEEQIQKNGEIITEKTTKHYRQISEQLLIEYHNLAAFKHAISIGLDPIQGPEAKIREELNKKIISQVKSKKITHLNLALAVQTPRTRITALLNLHTNQFTMDAMVQILGILGVQTNIHFEDQS